MIIIADLSFTYADLNLASEKKKCFVTHMDLSQIQFRHLVAHDHEETRPIR